MDAQSISSTKFSSSKYTRWYFAIIDNARIRVNDESQSYQEKHHVLPKSLWPEYGSFRHNPWNQVILTAREHFICHMLLVRMTSSSDRNKMAYALWGMCNQRSKHQLSRPAVTSNQYDSAKKSMRTALSNDRKGKSFVDLYGPERAFEIQVAMKTRKTRNPPSELEKQIASVRMRTKHQLSPWKRAIQLRPMPRDCCKHCGKETNLGNLARYHNDKCKSRSPSILEQIDLNTR